METEKSLTTQESLDIITEMITNAKGNVREDSMYFILWGAVIVLANLGMFTLIQTGYAHPYIAWTVVVPAWIVTIVMGFKHRRRTRVVTHLDRISMWLWFSFGIVTFTLIAFGKLINYQLNPVILLMCAIPTVISGLIIRFKPLIAGGIIFWLFGILCFIVGGPWQFLLGAFAVAIGYLVPGFMLRQKKEN